ncbi:MAG: prepilin-type N-terminal cleavage/methylation domain-containing protein [Patescibacteria group bacterium]
MSRYFNKNQKGFSLVELLVSLGIMVTILSVVISSQSTYTDTQSINNLADEISLTLSQSQAYGTAVKEFSPGSANFSGAYGMSLSLLSSGSNKDYIFFADLNGNNIYDGDWNCQMGAGFECLEKVTTVRGNYIDSFCILRSGGLGEMCDVAKRVDIDYVRPNTSAQINFFDNGGQSLSVPNTNGVKIILKTPQGKSRSVLAYINGQISVSN